MSDNFMQTLKNESRLLLNVQLKPVQGERFQPTGFPDLGPAFYTLSDKTPMLLVESAQSMANRLESVCWDESANDLTQDLLGMPYVRIDLGRLGTTSTLQEFHRLNSPYIWQGNTNETGQTFRDNFSSEAGITKSGKKSSKKSKKESESEESDVQGVLDLRKLAHVVFKYDPNSLIHGLFLEKISGRLRLSRALTSFIEARNVSTVESGGVKIDRVLPSPRAFGTDVPKLDAAAGFGNVPFHRTEFTAQQIVAYFNLDLALIRGYGFPESAVNFLVCLSLFKIQRFLSTGLRLRTACDLITVARPDITCPSTFSWPDASAVSTVLKSTLEFCSSEKLFAEPPVTRMSWAPAQRRASDTDGSELNND